jgi:polygalacturonase
MALLQVALFCFAAATDVTAFGAIGDANTVNTVAIQKAIDAVAAAGGGEVVFPPGQFVTGTIYMKTGVHLRLGAGCILSGSSDLADYPLNRCAYPSRSDSYTQRALIWAEGVGDMGIHGPGTIDGRGSHFNGKVATDEEVAAASEPFVKEGRYPTDKAYLNRPYLIRFVSCRNVTVENLKLRNSAMWMQHYLDCDFLTLRGLDVFNHAAPNNDMIDIDGCRDVLVADCIGDTDDDALTLKSTGAKPTERVVITNCILRSHCNAIKCGTESAGGFKDIAISNCVIQRSAVKEAPSGRPEGLAGIALEIVDGGTLERVAISNIVIEGTTSPLFMRLGDRGKAAKPSDPRPGIGTFRNITVNNVVATGASVLGCAFSGIPRQKIENLTLSNIRISFVGGGTPPGVTPPEVEDKYPDPPMFGGLPAYGFYFRHVRNLRLSNIDLSVESPDSRPDIAFDDVQDLKQ